MPAPILATKLYVPPLRPKVVLRPRLVERLDDGLAAGHKVTLVSAPAGFGKTTLIGEWTTRCGRPVAWLSLDEGDSDPSRFMTYLIAALQTVAPGIGEGVSNVLQSPQPPPPESTLTALLNDVATIPSAVVLVLDDYHVLDSGSVDDALAFLVEHLPPQVHLVIATREDPALPLARLRARGQLTELRAADLRFTPSEAAGFLNQVMDLDLSAEEIAALEARTEGWIAGLQLAALSLQGTDDVAGFIAAFAGGHRFVLDYLVEEVLGRQPEPIVDFLLRTSVLDRICGPLCDAVLAAEPGSGQRMLEHLERANLFVVPLDTQRRWFRYHHLFADLLRRRAALVPDAVDAVDADHLRASAWFEANGFDVEAFEQAAAGHDVGRAERLVEGRGMPLHFRGALAPVHAWLRSLTPAALDARPSLWVTYASVLLSAGQTSDIEPKLQAAERALGAAQPDEGTRDLTGRIANMRAMLALTRGQVETIIAESHRALAHLDPADLGTRTFTSATLGYAYRLKGDRPAARAAYARAIADGEASGNVVADIYASIGLGAMQEADNELRVAAGTYRRALDLSAGLPFPVISEAHLGLARIHYRWNDLVTAQEHAERSIGLARQLVNTDRFVACQVVLARLALARGDAAGAGATLAEAEVAASQHGFVFVMPEVAAAQVLVLLRRGDLTAAHRVAQARDIPLGQARVHLAQGDPAAALAVLDPFRRRMEERAWADARLEAIVLQALAFRAEGDAAAALERLAEALTLAEPEGFVRLFVDEGVPMACLLREALVAGVSPASVRRLLVAFPVDGAGGATPPTPGQPRIRLAEPLSQRELEVLSLLAAGLSNQEIAARLYLSLHTVKAHARTIYAKLGVASRTQAAAKARTLGLLAED